MSDQSRTDPTKEKKSDETETQGQGRGQGGTDPSKVDPKVKKPQPDPAASGSGAAGRPTTPVQTGDGTAGSNDGSPYSQYSKSSNESDEFDKMFNSGFGKKEGSGPGGAFTTSGTTSGGTRGDGDYRAARMGEELKVGEPVIGQPCGMEDNNFGGGNGGRDGEC